MILWTGLAFQQLKSCLRTQDIESHPDEYSS